MNYESFRKIEAWFYILVYLLEHDTENTQFFVNISNMVMTNPKKFFENVKKIKLSGKIFPLKNKLLPDPMKLIMQGKRKRLIWAYHVWQVYFIIIIFFMVSKT
jgi:hypothetical protein